MAHSLNKAHHRRRHIFGSEGECSCEGPFTLLRDSTDSEYVKSDNDHIFIDTQGPER